MSRPPHVWLAFGAALVVLLGVVAWISATALRLDRAEADARRLAAAEESVRLALWRMDSAVAPILARESARPYFAYQAFYPAERAFNRMFSELAAGEVLMPSPLLAERPEHVLLHFQIAPDGAVSSPQVPEGRMRRLAEARYATPGDVADAARRLAELRAALDRGALLAWLGPPDATVPVEPALAPGAPAANPATQATLAARLDAVPVPEATPVSPSPVAPPSPPRPEPVAPLQRAEAEQNQRSSLEWLARSKVVSKNSWSSAQSARPGPKVSSSPGSSSGSPPIPVLEAQPAASRPAEVSVTLRSPAVGQSSPPAPSSASAPAASAPTAHAPSPASAAVPDAPTVTTAPRERARDLHARRAALPEEPMRSAWIGERLLLVRRIHLDGADWIQGCWLDWDGLRSWLTEDARDLLPVATLEPARGVAPGERMLASIPARLVPGAVPVPPDVRSPVRSALGLAWTGLLLASLAVGLLLRGTLALSERRAAFVSAVTHELRSPLTTFRMYADMLALGMVRDEADRRSYLETLQRESARLSHLVENVLAYGRVERGRRPARAEPLAVADLLERHGLRLRERAEAAGLVLALEVASVRVRADAGAVEQILFNLVDNACKYAANAADRRVHLEVRRAGGKVELSVRDHGPGIGRADRRRLFLPFSRSAEAAAGSAPGVGLGLALCQRLARSLGGDLRYRDPEGGGAELVLSLPAA